MRLSLFIQFDDQFPCGFLGVSDLEESANLGDARQAQRDHFKPSPKAGKRLLC